MSGKIVGMVFDHYPNGGAERLLAVKLADNAHDDGTRIYPSVATLAVQTMQSERTVQYQLKRMLAMGWLLLVREAIGGGRGGGSGRPREYRIHPDWVGMHDTRIPEGSRPTWLPTNPVSHEKEMGAKFAPNKTKKWVQPSAEMGAIAVAEMGAIAVAPEPSVTVIEQIPPVSPTGDACGFEALIAHWPKTRQAKLAKARAAFDKVVKSGQATAAVLIAAAAAQAATDSWKRELGRFVPLPDSQAARSQWPMPSDCPMASTPSRLSCHGPC